MCVCVCGGGGGEGCGDHGGGNQLSSTMKGGLFIRISKGPDTIKILLIPPTPSSQVIVLNPGLFVGLFSSHEGFSCLGNLKD